MDSGIKSNGFHRALQIVTQCRRCARSRWNTYEHAVQHPAQLDSQLQEQPAGEENRQNRKRRGGMKSACRRRRGVWGLKEPDAHQLLMLNLECDHCLSAGFEQPAHLSRASPYPSFCFPLFDGHTFPPDSICFPCCCARQTRSPLMEVLSLCFLPYLSIVLRPFWSPISVSACRTLVATHTMPSLSLTVLVLRFFFFFYTLSSCSITFVFTPLQSPRAVWYPRGKKNKKKAAEQDWPALYKMFTLSVFRGGVKALHVAFRRYPSIFF